MHNLKIFVFVALCLVAGLSRAFPDSIHSKDLKVPVDSKFIIPEDAGMPDCYKAKEECKPEDWIETAKHFQDYIEEMVNNLVEAEVEKPECLVENKCQEEISTKYFKDFEDKKSEVQKIIKKANDLVGWWD